MTDRSAREQIGTAREQELAALQRHRGAEPPADPVALHRVAEAPADGVGHPRRVVGAVGEEAQRDRAGSPPAGPREGLERRTVADAPDQAERRLRPRARRARSTARPPLVRIRRRKPWVFCACGCWAGTCASTQGLLEAAARGPKSGTAREAETDRVYGPGTARRNAERPITSGENPRSPLSHKDAGATLPRLARPPAWPCGLPRRVTAPTRPTARAADMLATRSPHLWTLLWTTRTVPPPDTRRASRENGER